MSVGNYVLIAYVIQDTVRFNVCARVGLECYWVVRVLNHSKKKGLLICLRVGTSSVKLLSDVRDL